MFRWFYIIGQHRQPSGFIGVDHGYAAWNKLFLLLLLLAAVHCQRPYQVRKLVLVDGQESRLIVMEYVRYGSLSVFVQNKGKRISLDERLQLYKKFALDMAEVSQHI